MAVLDDQLLALECTQAVKQPLERLLVRAHRHEDHSRPPAYLARLGRLVVGHWTKKQCASG